MFEKNRNSEQQTLVLKNLDILAYTDATSYKQQQSPSLKRAEIQLQSTLIRNQEGNQFKIGCDLQQFKKYGPGVYLVFKFMKFLLLVMLFAIPFPVANIIIQSKYGSPGHEGSTLQDTTISNMPSNNPLIINFNFAVLLILTIALIYWKQNESKLVLQCSKQICMPSYFTVILTDIPNHYTERQVKESLEERYGKIIEIYTAKNYHDDIKKYKQIYEIVEDFKQERQYYIRNKSSESCIKMIDKFIKFREYHHQLSDNSCDTHIYQPYCAFITFQSCMQKWKLLEDQKQTQSFFSCTKNRQIESSQYKTQKVKFIHCEMQPDGVAWQNLNISTRQMALRCGLIAILLLIFLFLSITTIFIFVAAQSGLYLDKYSDQTYQQAINTNQTAALRGYCLDLSYSQFHSTQSCSQFQSSYINYCILFYTFPIAITVLKMILGSIMKKMVSIRRHKNSFQKLQWQIIIISLFYFIKSALIKFVIYRNFTLGTIQIKLLHLFLPILMRLKPLLPIYPEQIKTFNYFSGQWVTHASHHVISIAIFSFNFTILYHFFAHLISKKYHEYNAKKMLTQRRINSCLKGQQFEIEMVYAELIAVFLFCMMYFTCMPIIYLFIYFSLVLLYWASKYTFIKLCRKPLVYAHGINSLSVNLLFIGIIISCFVSPMYYEELNQSQTDSQKSMFAQLASHWQYLALMIFIIIYLVWGGNIINFGFKIYKQICSFLNPRHTNQSYVDQLKEITGGKGKIQSYSMHQNEKYRQILQILFIINKIQINKIGYLNNSKIEELKLQVNRKSHSFKLFDQMLQALQDQYNKLGNKSDKNIVVHQKYLKILKDIRDEVSKEIAGDVRQRQVHELVKSKIKQLPFNKISLLQAIKGDNSAKFKCQIKSQLSYDMNLDLPPETDNRFH